MKIWDKISRLIPVYEMNDREGAIAFFTQQLGLKTALEEGTLVHFADPDTGCLVLIVEDTPDLVNQKPVMLHNKTIIGVKDASKKCVSYEGYDFELIQDEIGVKSLVLNVPNPESMTEFYRDKFGLLDNTWLTFVQAELSDLPQAYDLEIIQFIAKEDELIDLPHLADDCQADYLSSKEDFLMLTDPLELEVWVENGLRM